MSLIDTIVSALRSLTGGSTQSTDTDSHREGQVAVEHDPDAHRAAADTSTEAAVKGTDPEPAAESAGDDEDSDAVAAGTDAAASTGTLVDEEAGREPAETVGEAGGVDVDQTAEEPKDAGADESEDVDETTDDADEETDEPEEAAATEDTQSEEATSTEDTQPEDSNSETAAVDNDEPVQTIKGIGPAYAERLDTVGIETVGELAAADAALVADGTDVSESRVGDWIERARDAS